jgi:two-component system, cell cycle sensor histidine kinase and response regulator CckA
VGQLAGGIAHDFNNLLTTILGAVSIAKENRDYGKLDDAETACMAAKTLTRQLLHFSKGSAAGNFSIVRPADVVRDAIRVAASGSSVLIKAELDDEAGPIEADRGQIIQVFQNLIINARQAMEDQAKGIITLRNRIVTFTEGQLSGLAGGDYVQIEVEDNGSGIPEDKIDRIFEPFFTTKKTGTGLGLATVLSIVRKHGGQLGVKSVVGTGTTFTVFLPVTEKSLEVTVRRPPSLRFGTGRILILDDDKQLCAITKAMLESLDYTVDVTHRGEDTLTFYRRYHAVDRPYDAVFLDLTIVGGMGGEEAFRNLQELDSDVRAIVCSGYDDEEMARHFLDAGFCGYLTKPYRVGDLSKMLKTVIGR